jgi:hypothetical protein
MSLEDCTPTSIPSLTLNGMKQNIRILWPSINKGKCGSLTITNNLRLGLNYYLYCMKQLNKQVLHC